MFYVITKNSHFSRREEENLLSPSSQRMKRELYETLIKHSYNPLDPNGQDYYTFGILYEVKTPTIRIPEPYC